MYGFMQQPHLYVGNYFKILAYKNKIYLGEDILEQIKRAKDNGHY